MSYQPPPAPQPAPYGMPARAAGTSWAAIVGLIAGILSLITFCFWPTALLFGVVAIVMFFIARGQIAQGMGGQPMALIGLILGIVGMIVALALIALGVAILGNPQFQSAIGTALATLTPGN